MTSTTELANRALSSISARSTITSLEDDDSPTAKVCRTWFDTTRDELLRAAPWSCGTKTDRLTLKKAAPGTPENADSTETTWNPATMPATPWLYQYAYPADCLFVRWVAFDSAYLTGYNPFSVSMPLRTAISMNAPYVKFEVALGTDTSENEMRVINTNAQSAVCKYVRRVENPDLWDAAFQGAFVAALAANIAFAISGKTELSKIARQQAMASVTNARARDGNEGLTVNTHTPDWIKKRGYAGGDSFLVDGTWVPWITPSFLLS
jgi:hypothetical protein